MNRTPSLPAAALLLATALLLAPATANDQVRDVQAALKTRGFYYGELTGTDTAETGTAIRRFQIRNGITVTGKLDAATLAALGIAEKRTIATVPQPQPKAAEKPPAGQIAEVPAQNNPGSATPKPPAMPKPGEPILGLRKERKPPPEDPPAEVAHTPALRLKTADVSVVDPPTPVPAPVVTQFTTMLRDTPYATATRDEQSGIIRRAQAVLAARRLYRGPIDGIAGVATSEALFLFQDESELHRTGRLDTDTLAEMKLLPNSVRGNPLLKPFYNPNRRRDRSLSAD